LKLFSSIPFFRIIIPFLLGILTAINFNWRVTDWFYLFLLLIPLTFFNFYKAGYRRYKWLFMISADIFLFLFGISLVHLKEAQSQKNYFGKSLFKDSTYTFIGVISNLPIEKEKFVKCELSLNSLKKDTNYISVSGTTIAYFKKSIHSKKLEAGQILLIHSRFLEIDPPKNPLEFNYNKYLQHKQINHSLFVDSISFQVLEGVNPLNVVWYFGLQCKKFVLTHLKNSSLSQQSYAICAALLTGYDDEIDKTVMDAFAHSGTLHVLSVSGLHTGLIYLVLNFLFDLIDKKRRYKLSRFLIITFLLWFFALLTGFSAPVLRAVIMFNLLGAGNLFFRNQLKNQINILFVSAFILLSFNPFFITDIGFLLSYFALFGLMYFQPKLTAIWQPKNKIIYYFWQSVCISFAATLSTLPLTLFYFKQFPIWFFVCNIVVVPATFLLLILAVFILFKLNVFAIISNYLVSALSYVILLFNHEHTGYIDNIHFTHIDVLFLICLIILLSVALELRSYKYLKISLVLLITWQCNSMYASFLSKQKSLLTVYHLKNQTAISVKNKTQVNIQYPDTSGFNYSVKPHLISFNYPVLKNQRFNYVVGETAFVLILKDRSLWPEQDLKQVNTLVLCSNFIPTEKELSSFPNLQRIVVDGSNRSSTANAAEKLSRKFGVDFYNTKLKGAYLLSLP
jgi:competence protein ComEC